MPTTPLSAAGWRIEPPVSVPMPSGAWYADTATAEPPLLPPGTVSRSHGLLVGPNALCSVDEPIANSSMFVLPRITAPDVSQPLGDVRVVRGEVALEDARPGGRLAALDRDEVLEGDRDAEERMQRIERGRAVAAGHREAGIGRVRFVQRPVGRSTARH